MPLHPEQGLKLEKTKKYLPRGFSKGEKKPFTDPAILQAGNGVKRGNIKRKTNVRITCSPVFSRGGKNNIYWTALAQKGMV